jgi:hypothetical protein
MPLSHPVPRYSILALMFNKSIDQGQSASIDEVYRRLEDGSLFDWLAETYEDAAVYLYQYEPAVRRTILTVLGSLANVTLPEDLGITNNGLGLCLAYCIEVMQSPEGHADPDDDDA